MGNGRLFRIELWPSNKFSSIRSQATWPPANPNWFKQQDLMASLGPFAMGGGGGGGGGQQVQASAAAVEEVVEEVAVEKTHFDVELSSFDAKAKIKVIKEIRGLLGLGLKEAKEMVESSPQWIKKELPKEEAEELCAKLTALGAVMRMA